MTVCVEYEESRILVFKIHDKVDGIFAVCDI